MGIWNEVDTSQWIETINFELRLKMNFHQKWISCRKLWVQEYLVQVNWTKGKMIILALSKGLKISDLIQKKKLEQWAHKSTIKESFSGTSLWNSPQKMQWCSLRTCTRNNKCPKSANLVSNSSNYCLNYLNKIRGISKGGSRI